MSLENVLKVTKKIEPDTYYCRSKIVVNGALAPTLTLENYKVGRRVGAYYFYLSIYVTGSVRD